MTTEEWRPIPGHPGYEASPFGEIRSYWTTAHRIGAEPRILRASNSGHIYRRVFLAGVGFRYVHRLIALTFIGPAPEGQNVVRHLDDDPLNNTPANLAYGTQVENAHDAVRNGRNRLALLTHCKHGHEFTEDNTIRRGEAGRECRECARRNGRESARRTRARKRTEAAA